MACQSVSSFPFLFFFYKLFYLKFFLHTHSPPAFILGVDTKTGRQTLNSKDSGIEICNYD